MPVFVGHYAPSFALRRTASVPLWVLFLAAQFVDILWAGLVLAGIERVRIVPGFTATSPLALDYMPYSHSLVATVGWALLLGGIGALLWQWGGGLTVGACVLAHWFLDLLVHTPDLPLLGDTHKVGLGLWNAPAAAFALEASLLLAAVALYTRGAARAAPFWIFAIAILAMQASAFVLPIPPTPNAFAQMALANYLGLALAAGLLERRWGPTISARVERSASSSPRHPGAQRPSL